MTDTASYLTDLAAGKSIVHRRAYGDARVEPIKRCGASNQFNMPSVQAHSAGFKKNDVYAVTTCDRHSLAVPPAV